MRITDLTVPAPEAEAGAQLQPDKAARDLTEFFPGLAKIAAGEIPGAYVPAGWSTPEIDKIAPTLDEIAEVGLQVYAPLDKSIAMVLVNDAVSEEDLKAADKAGKLTALFPPIADVLGAPGQAETPEAINEPPLPVATPPAAPAAQRALASARVRALGEGEQPSERPMPGAGKLANSILKRVI